MSIHICRGHAVSARTNTDFNRFSIEPVSIAVVMSMFVCLFSVLIFVYFIFFLFLCLWMLSPSRAMSGCLSVRWVQASNWANVSVVIACLAFGKPSLCYFAYYVRLVVVSVYVTVYSWYAPAVRTHTVSMMCRKKLTSDRIWLSYKITD